MITKQSRSQNAINKLSLNELEEIIKTDEYEMDLYSKIMTKVSLYFVYIFSRTPITANQLTLLMLFIGFGTACAFAFNKMLLGIVLLHTWYMFDWVDGAIARLKNQCTKTGWYYDHLVHLLNHPLFFVSIGYGLYIQTNKLYIFILSIIAAYAHLIDVSSSDTYMMVLFKNLLDSKVEYKSNQSLHSNSKNYIALIIHFPKIINIYTFSVLIDYILVIMELQKYYNITFVITALYGIVLPIYVILRFIKNIKSKAIDKEYDHIMKNLK